MPNSHSDSTSIKSTALLISSVALLIATTAINTSSILKKLAIIALFTYVTFQLFKASPPLADRLPLFIVSFLIASITVPIIMWIGLAISAIYLVKVPYMEIWTCIRKHLEKLSKQGQSIWEWVIRTWTCIRGRQTQQAEPDLERGDGNDGPPQ